ncbi:MAG: hypothetical protein J6S21_02500, partial [Victivallales bacterium]|nr:hypothetical protein [Victivallales bacterium]
MNISDLPVGNFPDALSFPYFPTRWQLFIWRNWGIVAAERIAKVLSCSEEQVTAAAVGMGLPEKVTVLPQWKVKGYQTIIRRNWHILDYEQLLELLDWTPERLDECLQHEDFFYVKLGCHKPRCGALQYAPLTDAQAEATAVLRATVGKYFSAAEMLPSELPFAFADNFGPRKRAGVSDDFDFNYIHSYAASCGDVLGEAEESDPVPENILEEYESCGVKGVWMHALLCQLVPIPGAESFSRGYEKRMANLKRIVERCGKHGIKVFLYLNEPRGMNDEFYRLKPEWKGAKYKEELPLRAICTTASPEPLQWLENAMYTLFRETPGLGGVFTITMSENPTNCYSHVQSKSQECLCPSCSRHSAEEVVAGVISAMERGMHAAAPEAKFIAYDWAWIVDAECSFEENFAFKKKIMNLLPKSVYVCSVSEWGMITNVGGVEQYLRDYAISQVGPSEESRQVWEYANSIGLKTAAKVQLNNSWEMSAVPYIPVPYLVREHIDRLKKAGVSALMLSWTLGGCPGGNLPMLDVTPEELAAAQYSPEHAPAICRAWKEFSEAFRNFPFNVQVIYESPVNFGPSCLLFDKTTGYPST